MKNLGKIFVFRARNTFFEIEILGKYYHRKTNNRQANQNDLFFQPRKKVNYRLLF